MKTDSCPTPENLVAYTLGRLPEAQLHEVARHAGVCPKCQAQLVKADSASDELIEHLRHQPAPVPFDSEPSMAQLVPRLQASIMAPNDATLAGPSADDAEVALELQRLLSPPQAPDEIGRLGSYRVLKVLGAGGMGIVLLAEDPQLHRKTALKVMKPMQALHPTAHQRFLREAQATAQVRNDHVVTIYQVAEEASVPFLAMELLEGETLADYLQRSSGSGRPFLPASEIVRIGAETVAGLAAAHERGLIHRDIKPSNIWLEKDRGRVKIVDFGLARLQDDSANLTQAGSIVGTPAYMSPEQANGQTVDARSDLFSVGSVLYQLCTGQTPFQGASTFDILLSVVTKEPRPIAELNPATPPALVKLVNQLMAKSPAERPATARVVLNALQTIDCRPGRPAHADATLTDRVSITPAPPSQGWRRSPAPLLIVAAVVVAVACGLAYFVVAHRGAAQATNVLAAVSSSGAIATALMPQAEFVRMVDQLEKGGHQIDAINGRMKALNPGFPGIGLYQEGFWMHEPVPGKPNKVRKVVFCSDTVKDIAPLAALTELKRLSCSGSKPGSGKVADLSPLKDLKLIDLDINCTDVSDLAPLQGMGESMRHLSCRNTRVKDLTPLKALTGVVELECDAPSKPGDLEVLRLLNSVKKINGQAKREFLKAVEAALSKKQ